MASATSIRALFRRFRTSETAKAYVLSGGAAMVIGLIVFLVIRANSLDALERDCRDHILAEPQMAGVSHLSADRHYDFWNDGASGGGAIAPWSVQPHTVGKVVVEVTFSRGDKVSHHSWMECFYTIDPGTGDPPRLAFDRVDLGWEYVLDEAGHHIAWHPDQTLPK